MSQNGRDALNDEIWKAIEHALSGFDLDYGEVVGVLTTVQHQILAAGEAARKKNKGDDN